MTTKTWARMPARRAGGAVPPGAGRLAAQGPLSGSRMFYSRLIGALFLLGFLSFLAKVPAHQTALVLGALLMLANTAVDIGKAVLFFPIIERWGRRTALAYLGMMVFEVAVMAVGVLALMMLVPLADQAGPGQLGEGVAQSLGTLAVDGNEMAYQISQMSLGFGALFLCYLLLRSGLIPRSLAILGLVGYATHMLGAIFELFGVHISMVLLIPGGIFEVSLAVWLLVKGFRPEAYSQES
jgi:hypothetical protein